jgi:hypothetical protein
MQNAFDLWHAELQTGSLVIHRKERRIVWSVSKVGMMGMYGSTIYFDCI